MLPHRDNMQSPVYNLLFVMHSDGGAEQQRIALLALLALLTAPLRPLPNSPLHTVQSPYITIGNPTVVVIPEYKRVTEATTRQGIRLFTCHVRRGAADVQDPMWNSHSKLNCIAACILVRERLGGKWGGKCGRLWARGQPGSRA